MGFRLFVLLKRRSGQVCSMAWRVRGTVVSWANRSVGVPSCPALPRPAAPPCAAPTRPARGMPGFWIRHVSSPERGLSFARPRESQTQLLLRSSRNPKISKHIVNRVRNKTKILRAFDSRFMCGFSAGRRPLSVWLLTRVRCLFVFVNALMQGMPANVCVCRQCSAALHGPD